MKLLRLGPPGRERPTAIGEDGRAVDVSGLVADFGAEFFAAGGLERLRAALPEAQLPEVDIANSRVGACIARPSQVLCIGLNYADHAAESGMEPPAEPVVFNKAPNTVVGAYDQVLLPPRAEKVDWEVELGLVVGHRARYLADEAAAAEAIAGYCICHDVSERAWQLEHGGQWVKGKSAETFNPTGPWLATRDEVDPRDLELELWVNGERQQHGTTRNLIFGVDHIVWYLSQFMVLEPGDLICTGTPAGVGFGMDPPRFLRERDVVELAITGLGTQRQECRRATV